MRGYYFEAILILLCYHGRYLEERRKEGQEETYKNINDINRVASATKSLVSNTQKEENRRRVSKVFHPQRIIQRSR